MTTFISRLSSMFTQKRKASRPLAAKPRLEHLERRDALSITTITDMTQLASQFPAHAGATMLYLNFDGHTSQGVSAFQNVTGDAKRDIHDILFKTQQMFAPFNVTVSRIYGNGAMGTSGGASTVFIGDYSKYTTTTAGVTTNNAGGETPWASSDYPGLIPGITHVPNSNTSDFTIVDPVFSTGISNPSRSTAWIAQTIAHESGHTFGLVHVTTTASQPDTMSYDTTNARFMNTTFAISARNFDAATGVLNNNDPNLIPQYFHIDYLDYYPYSPYPHLDRIFTQNSYTYLARSLGLRSVGSDLANVADSNSVDAVYRDGSKIILSPGASASSSLTKGDFDVFKYTAMSSSNLALDAKRATGSSVDTVLYIYDSTGQNLLYFNDDANGSVNSQIIFRSVKGETYQIVVGGYGANSTGNYTITLANSLLTVTSPLKAAIAPSFISAGSSGQSIASAQQTVIGGVAINAAMGSVATYAVATPNVQSPLRQKVTAPRKMPAISNWDALLTNIIFADGWNDPK